MIAARQIAFGRGGKRKPYDAEVEYLQSTGTQYIDTGVFASLNTSVDIKAQFTELFNDNALIAMDNGYGTKESFVLEYYSKFGICLSIGGASPYWRTTTVMTVVTNTWYDISAGRASATVNGVSFVRDYNSGTPVSFSSLHHLYMFAFGRKGAPIIFGKARIAYSKIYDKGVLLRDFIPVRVGDVGYMYDRVSGQLFSNAGTGAFRLGPDAVPASGGGCNRRCIRRSYRRSWRASTRFSPRHLWKEVA